MRLGAAMAVVLILAGCRIENRAPAGSLRDDEAIRGVVATYYSASTSADWAAVRGLFWDGALIQRGPAEGGVWRAFDSPDAFQGWLETGGWAAPLEPVRVEPRQDGDLAAVWVSTRRAGTERGMASSDHFLLRRIDGAWRITSLASATSTPAPAVR
ncbi:MAG TPA: nuclear transport factor 2 family protein [Gemmatimonadales bacterium]|nr:nuclear transport factor 2 family protein [Gemmatimonadales bacterium]